MLQTGLPVGSDLAERAKQRHRLGLDYEVLMALHISLSISTELNVQA